MTSFQEEVEQVLDSGSYQDLLQKSEMYGEAFAAFSNEFLFDGRSLEEWSTQMSLPIPRDLDPEKIQSLFISLAMKIQIASHYYSLTHAMHTAIQKGTALKKNKLFRALISSYEERNMKRPAASALERIAEDKMLPLLSEGIIAQIVKDFWKQRLDALTDVRRLLEQLAISKSVEMKYLETTT